MVCAVLDTAQARGADRQRLLRGTGIFEEDIHRDYLISPQQLLVLLSNAQSQARSRDTAFQIGKSLASSHLCELQSALAHCYSLADVIRLCSQARWLFSPLISFHRFNTQDDALFILEDAIGCGKTWLFVVEIYTALWVALCKHWSGQRQPFHFAFPGPRPRQIQEYEANLGYRLSFDAPLLAIRISRQVLAAPLPDNDRFHRDVLRAQLRQYRWPVYTLPDAVRAAVRGSAVASLEDVAASYKMSVATLKRRLREHNMSFRELLDETRRAQAIYLLSVQKLTNERSACRMAFTDLANFRRAVKRWTGQTPSELRQV